LRGLSPIGGLAAALLYVVAAVVLTWPLAGSLTTHLGALQGPGDPYLNLWILGWGMHAWITDPIGVLTGRVFDANIFFPARDALTYSDHFLLQALPLSPIYALTGDAVLCYNLLLIVSIALSGLAMHAYVRSITASTPAAFLAGLAWACWPYRTAHLLHIQLQALYFLPLAMLFLHRLVAGRRTRDAVLLGVMAGLQAIASVYYGVMTMVAIAVGGVVLAIATGQWRSRRLLGGLVLAALLGIVLVAPVLIPYRRSQEAQGFGRNLYEAANHSAAVQSYTQVPRSNALYGRTGTLTPRGPREGERNREGVEHQLFPGLVILGLALIGVWTGWRRDARPIVILGCALVIVGAVLSFGPEGVRPLYAWLYDVVYGFQAIRAPARFAVIAMLGLTLLAAIGMRAIARGAKAPPLPTGRDRAPFDGRGGALAPPARAMRTGLIASAIIGLMAIEYVNTPLAFAPAPPRETAVGQWLKSAPTPGAVLHLPLTVDIENTPFMVQSLEHWRPIVNGYSGQRPAFFPALVDALADLPEPTALATLKELDVRFVVSPSAIAGADTPASPLAERARVDGHVIYEMAWTPESEAALDGAIVVAEPPPPGEIPFVTGETLTYEIRWDGGRVGLPAGTATLRASAEVSGNAAWRFVATAETADWVSSFFEARDRFVTLADSMLSPLEHVREIREGRRQQDRVFIYDAARRLVTTGQTRDEAMRPDALAFALAPGARDAVTALYYVRTLAMVAGSAIDVPLNEAGRNLVLSITTGDEETIEYRGQPVRARRLEPVIRQRVERRKPVQIVVWLSADAQRVPLLIEVDAGFGRVRAELVARPK
jgi:hypothetical protein